MRFMVWDRVVRSVHWLLAATVAFDLWFDDGGYTHRVVGYVAAALVLIRLTWSVLASGLGGLRHLLPSVGGTIAYLKAGAPPGAGHDPLGVWMIWWLWVLVLLLGVTGWMSRLDAFWGDERLHDMHALLAQIVLVSAIVHVGAVALMSWRWRQNLTRAMITGKRAGLQAADGTQAERKP